MKTTPTPTAAESWQACEGEVGSLVHRLRRRRRASRLRRGTLVATLAVLTLTGNYYYTDVATELAIKATGKPCDHYSQELRAFYCDDRGELDAKFWEHLSKCPDCQRDFKFFGSIAHSGLPHSSVAHASHLHKATRTLRSTHPISLERLLQHGTIAAQR